MLQINRIASPLTRRPDVQVLQDFTLRVPPNTTAALVRASHTHSVMQWLPSSASLGRIPRTRPGPRFLGTVRRTAACAALVRSRPLFSQVGSSGSGKSTVVALLQRFYESASGAIRIDGQELRAMDPAFLHQSIGFVQQEPTLFGLSIFDNVCYGVQGRAPGAEEVRRVCEQA